MTEEGYEILLPAGLWIIQAKAENEGGEPGWKWSANALVEVSGQGELSVDLQAGPADASRECEEIGFPIPPDRVVPARIVDATSGEPIEGVEVRTSLGKWTSAATGELELHFLPRRADTLRIGAAGGWRRMRMEVATPPEGLLEIPLHRTVACRVRVLDPLGIPLRFMPSIRLRDVTGHEFRLEEIDFPLGLDLDCPEGVFEIELVTGRGRYVHPEPVTIPGPEIVVQLSPAGGLDLRVPELEIEYDQDWPDGVEVVLEPLDDQASEPLVRRDDLYLNGLPVGRYWVRVAAPDRRRWEGGAEVRDDEVRTVYLW
jgi:hypothetical protein